MHHSNYTGCSIQEELFTATKRFVIIRDLKIKMADCNENTSYEDNTMTVQYVPLTKSTSLFNDDEEVEEQNLDLSSKEVQVGSNGMPVCFLIFHSSHQNSIGNIFK